MRTEKVEWRIRKYEAPDSALLFLQYLLDPAGGLEILKAMGQPLFVPCRVPI
jgi:molybdate/tungstate transport system substrate-binding protein